MKQKMRNSNIITLAVVLAAVVMLPTSVFGQLHGVTIAKGCVGPLCEGETTSCDIQLGYNDHFGDTIRVLSAWDVEDFGGDNVRVPVNGDLPIVNVGGNTTCTTGGVLPCLIGPGGSTLSGLPGDIQPGFVRFRQNTYVVQPDDPDLLRDQATVEWEDLCDDPDTMGCGSGIINPAPAPASTTVANCAEREALIALYNSTDGPNWANNSGWLGEPGTECSWYGITCENDIITEINLNSNQLSGTIPHEIGNLTSLIGLYLFDNQLGGSIPSTFSGMSLLVAFHFANNCLTSGFEYVSHVTNLDGVDAQRPVGDINSDAVLDLEDVITTLQIVSNIPPEQIDFCGDANSDSKIGLEEAIYALQVTSGLNRLPLPSSTTTTTTSTSTTSTTTTTTLP